MKTLLLALLLLIPINAMADKPIPPPQLANFFSEVVELEDAIGEGEWDEAQATLNEIGELTGKVVPIIAAQIGESPAAALEKSYRKLEADFKSRSKKRISAALVILQARLFEVMDGFLYLVHPAVLVIDQYVKEGAAALKLGDFDRAEHELEEIRAFVAKAAPVLETKGAGSGMRDDFKLSIERAMQACLRKDAKKAGTEFEKLERVSAAFVWMVSQP